MAQDTSSGRKANEAEPAGKFTALGGEHAIKETGKRSQDASGPDGGDAADIGDTFKGPKGDPAEGKRT
jgi:hypothetical protein